MLHMKFYACNVADYEYQQSIPYDYYKTLPQLYMCILTKNHTGFRFKCLGSFPLAQNKSLINIYTV